MVINITELSTDLETHLSKNNMCLDDLKLIEQNYKTKTKKKKSYTPKKRTRRTRNIVEKYFNTIRHRAIYKNIELKIDEHYIIKILNEQNNNCKLSNLPISIENNTASLDRINSKLGYVEDNVQWVHKWINVMKLDFTQEEFIQFCKAVAEHNKGETCQLS